MDTATFTGYVAAANQVRRAEIIEILKSGEIWVQIEGDPPLRVACDVLQTVNKSALPLHVGSTVLVLVPATTDEPGCVLGTVGPYEPRPNDRPAAETILEATNKLVIKCGESSITMHDDGKMLVKGVDIVTRVKRTHKIKAGTVHIN